MENIFTILQQIFLGKEDKSVRVGISEFKKNTIPTIQKKRTFKKTSPQQLKISELMRKTSC